MGTGARIERHEKIRDISNFTRCRSELGTWNTRKGNEEESNTSLLKGSSHVWDSQRPTSHFFEIWTISDLVKIEKM